MEIQLKETFGHEVLCVELLLSFKISFFLKSSMPHAALIRLDDIAASATEPNSLVNPSSTVTTPFYTMVPEIDDLIPLTDYSVINIF